MSSDRNLVPITNVPKSSRDSARVPSSAPHPIHCDPSFSSEYRCEAPMPRRCAHRQQQYPAASTASSSFAAPLRPVTLSEFQASLATVMCSRQSVAESTVHNMMMHLSAEAYTRVEPLFSTRSSLESFITSVQALDAAPHIPTGFEMPLREFQRIVLDELALSTERAEFEHQIASLMSQLGPESKSLVEDIYETKVSIESFLEDLRKLRRHFPASAFQQDEIGKVFCHLTDAEDRYWPRSREFFCGVQSDVTARMRSILVDWLVDVSGRFQLSLETLHMAVGLIDRFLTVQKISRKELQLVGITAMLIAAKYEEIYPPTVDDFVFVSAGSYTKQEVLRMERRMFVLLEFRVTMPSSFSLACCTLAEQDPVPSPIQRSLVYYFLEVALVCLWYGLYRPSEIAMAAVYMSRIWCRLPTPPPPEPLSEIVRVLVREVEVLGSPSTKLAAVRNKYSSGKMSRVSALPVPAELAHH